MRPGRVTPAHPTRRAAACVLGGMRAPVSSVSELAPPICSMPVKPWPATRPLPGTAAVERSACAGRQHALRLPARATGSTSAYGKAGVPAGRLAAPDWACAPHTHAHATAAVARAGCDRERRPPPHAMLPPDLRKGEAEAVAQAVVRHLRVRPCVCTYVARNAARFPHVLSAAGASVLSAPRPAPRRRQNSRWTC